ncbi:hypothetical protein B0F90DRAFT_1725593 [Multifurca ochricompacta]|uniref:protein-tyrosine-phosphatase n=1 Tax=Multifurca ochricompacta TaxID=376703 RepID=A0AAD4M3T2_9AGAM|nr:hypothetical protein B0F90DRAFT_1725593 [Multifurca ochricompacta]
MDMDMDDDYHHMDQVLPGLWIGDLHSAKDSDTLRTNNIHSILTVMRGKFSIHETFFRHQVPLDDVEETDVLQHLIPSITFIQSELDKGGGVLVHCQAGMSRSATIAAAYIMYSQNLDVNAAIELIRKVRPNISPNAGFVAQLEIFYQASYRVSRRDKATRMFYLERAVEDILNGDGSAPETDMFAKFPRTPTDSAPATPGGPRRRIRCKMCRTELANREHMLDHGQLGPPTPALAFSPVSSRRPSTHDPVPRRPSSSSSRRPSGGALSLTLPRPRLGSTSIPTRPSPLTPVDGGNGLTGLAASLSMSTLDDDESKGASQESELLTGPAPQAQQRRSSSFGSDLRSRLLAGISIGIPSNLSMSALDSDDDESAGFSTTPSATVITSRPGEVPTADTAPSLASPGTSETIPEDPKSASIAGKARPPPALSTTPAGVGALQHGADLAAQLHANPKLAALRSPGGLTMTPLQSAARVTDKASISPPILMNPKCSGYFVEPMKWMGIFLQDGQLAGKIICPNKKCGAKLGNYDWAGVCCSCKEWVVPGFCIHRSKVDEII